MKIILCKFCHLFIPTAFIIIYFFYYRLKKIILTYFIPWLQSNTFQVVLTTDGQRTFVIFLYSKLDWTTGRLNAGNTEGLDGHPSQVWLQPFLYLSTFPWRKMKTIPIFVHLSRQESSQTKMSTKFHSLVQEICCSWSEPLT